MSKSPSLRQDVYRKLCTLLTTCQSAQGAKSCRVLNFDQIEESPFANPGQMPSLHLEVCKYFRFQLGNRILNGNTILVGKTRWIDFSFLMEADVPIEDIGDVDICK